MPGREPTIIFTDNQCLLGGIPYPEIPLLINYDCRVIEAPSDWLRYLMVTRRRAASSVRQFAYHLKYWWTFLNRARVAWDEVDDFLMREWRDKCLLNTDKATVNGYVSTVFKMYLWAEKSGYTDGLIGEADFARKVRPPLSVEVNFRRHGTKTYSSPLLVKTTAKPILPVPTNDGITKVHQAIAELYGDNVDLMVRDTLILTWMEQTGTRRAEVCGLKRAQIPEWDEILSLGDTGEKKEITITGKGDKKRSIWVGPDLLEQTREYIEEERQAIIKRFCNLLGPGYRNPESIFLSSKSGRPLVPDTVSQKFAKAFRKAGVKGSGHRARARFLSNLLEYTLERDVERLGAMPDMMSVLLPVAQIAGHSNTNSLKPYLAVPRKRLLGQTIAERKAANEEKAVATERRVGAMLIKLKAVRSVRELVKAIDSGNKRTIANALSRIQEEFAIS